MARWPLNSTWGVAAGAFVLLALAGCASAPRDIAPYAFACTHGQSFEARLYRDMAVLEGGRGHDQLPRQKDGADGSHVYGDGRLTATFGLGVERRLATLRYADIPNTIHCERVQLVFAHSLAAALAGSSAPAEALPPLEVSRHEGPKKPEPPKPIPLEDRVYTNVRFGGGPGPN